MDWQNYMGVNMVTTRRLNETMIFNSINIYIQSLLLPELSLCLKKRLTLEENLGTPHEQHRLMNTDRYCKADLF